ncbi:hypothetical protein M413DRAFT_162941 [Hebeloma cylindrosporum]|uniref:Uncharacterized protein n=1 Tax=Hebeloma cylindrosporum TaxID=76867 RepID=A0A0C2XS11_HEBCY|nr:hypothetical protein M413DRAFT_162941 [Hebeloma cylindrosporum h7]
MAHRISRVPSSGTRWWPLAGGEGAKMGFFWLIFEGTQPEASSCELASKHTYSRRYPKDIRVPDLSPFMIRIACTLRDRRKGQEASCCS